MAEETDGRDGRTPTRSLRVSPLRSLPARISFIVFGATLITSLAVTAISVRSIDSFLRGKIEQKFPAVLESANQRLDLWYDQRLLELGVFASSGILTQNLPRIGPGTSRPEVKRARSEIEQYLAYVLDSFPQYDSLFVLAPDGDELLWVGSRLELSGDALHRLSRVSDTSLSGALRSGERSVQVASARVEGGRKAIAGTLHAVMQMSAVTSVLKGQELGESGEIFLLDADNRYLSASEPRLAMGSWFRTISNTPSL